MDRFKYFIFKQNINNIDSNNILSEGVKYLVQAIWPNLVNLYLGSFNIKIIVNNSIGTEGTKYFSDSNW